MDKRQTPEDRPGQLHDPKLPVFRAGAPTNRANERVCQAPRETTVEG